MKLKILCTAAIAGMAAFAALSVSAAAESVTVGDFTLTDAVVDTEYTWDDTNGVLTILDGAVFTVANTDPTTATSDRIEFVDGAAATITLAGVNIDTEQAAMLIADDSIAAITITTANDTVNTLKSGDGYAGIQKNGGAGAGKLTINGYGPLTAIGGANASGIGASEGETSCNITFDGAVVHAFGGENGAGISSANDEEMTTVITNSAIYATSIYGIGSDPKTSIVIEGTNGIIYGTHDLYGDFTIPEGAVLDIGASSRLNLQSGAVLTNNGTINNSGMFVAYSGASLQGSGEQYNIGAYRLARITNTTTIKNSTIQHFGITYPYDNSKEIVFSGDGSGYCSIVVNAGVSADIALKGVIAHDLTIAEGSRADVNITLVDDTTNQINICKPGQYTDTLGTLTIQCEEWGDGHVCDSHCGYLGYDSDHRCHVGGGDSSTANIIINGGNYYLRKYTVYSGQRYYYSAALGSGYGDAAQNIIINGGIIDAIGSIGDSSSYGGGAAIGSGSGGSVKGITINGGKITATTTSAYDVSDKYGGACIGAGYGGTADGITINGGTITLTANSYYNNDYGNSVCIGGSTASNISITGGTVTCNGLDSQAVAIGGNSGENISISGGIVTVTGTDYSISYPPIGWYSPLDDSVVAITGGSVKVTRGAITPAPTLSNGTTPVYLNTISNPNALPITIGGTKYPIAHSSSDTNVYVYLPTPSDVSLGGTTVRYIYDTEAKTWTGTISNIDLQIDAPVALEELDTTVGADLFAVSASDVTWTEKGEAVTGVAGYNTVYTATAVITLTDDTFAISNDLTVSVNGNTAQLSENEDGTLTISYEFAATDKADISEIKVTSLPDKCEYIVGEMLIVDGCRITVYRADDTSESVDVVADMVSGFESNTAGTKILTVTYEGYTATFEVQVRDIELDAIAGDRKVTLTWEAVDGATQYAVYRSTNGSAYTRVSSNVTDTSYIFTGLTNGTKYYFTVKTCVNGVWTAMSKAVTAIPAASMTAPTNLKATAGDGKVTVAWDAPTGATQYAVYRSTDGSAYTRVSANVTGTIYTFTGLTNGTKYYFTVKAYGNGVWSAMSDAVTATPVASMTAPTNLKATAGDGKVTVTWTASAGATQYAVYRSTDGSVYTRVSANVTGTTYTFTGLKNGTKYYFKVKAYGNGVWTAMSDAVIATPVASMTAPTNLKATAGDGKVTVTWTASAGATQYAVYYSTNHSTYYLLNSKVTGTTYIADGLKNGIKYSFKVKAYGSGKWTGFSDAVYATPAGSVATPTNLKATAGNSKVTVTWAASAGATQYAVYRSTDGSVYTRVSSNVTGTSYTFTGLKNGTKYYFVVKAYGNGIWTAMSEAVAAIPVASLTAPTGLEAVAGDGEVTVTWDAPAGATQYAVYYSVDGVNYIRASASVTGTSYTFTGLTNGTRYYFVVKAYGNGVWTAMSDAVIATPDV